MTAETKLVAEKREKLGSIACRHLRRDGFIPGVVYGHGQDSESIVVPGTQVTHLVFAGSRVVDLEFNGETQKAMFRDVQWDTFGREIQHFDLIRVDSDERVTVDINIEIRGTSPGVVSGGRVEQSMRSIEVDCLAVQIPDHITARIGELEIGDTLYVKDLDVPAGANIHVDGETAVIHVSAVVELEEPEADLAAEPEVIGRKAEDEEGEAE